MEFCIAMRTAGRMRPAAHPQIEFTTTIVVPGRLLQRFVYFLGSAEFFNS